MPYLKAQSALICMALHDEGVYFVTFELLHQDSSYYDQIILY